MAGKQSEFKAGLVVLVALLVLALGLYLVSGGPDQFKDKKQLTILFRNGGGIGTGDAVYVAGRRVGKVYAISAAEEVVNGETGTYVVVEVQILKDARVHRDSRISVSKTVTGIVTLNIEFGESGELAPAGSKLVGQKLATFEETIDRGAALLEDARSMIRTVDGAVLELDKAIRDIDMAGLRTRLDKALDKLDAALGGLDGLIQRADKDVDMILKDAKAGATNFRTLTDELLKDWGPISESLRATLKGAQRASKDLEALLSENRPALKQAIQNLADGTLRVGPVLLQIERLAQAAENMVLDASPKLSSGLRAAALAFKNFQAVTEDLKTAPWKLINEPTDAESDEVHLYNAARKFVDSAERIQEVLEDLDALRKQGGLSDETMKARLDALSDRLQQSLKNYTEREKTLVGMLRGTKNGK